ncbi:MAG: hypothetical protein KTR30_14890 [Saprospiraceae bacterium]|nr:hypothetical protein [Saprospiraceae bacterium]
MKKKLDLLQPATVLICLWLGLFACQVPTQEESVPKKWYKGNLHTHSYWSDGDEFPEVIMDWYKSHGYHFLALSDHNILAEGDMWVKIREDSIYQKAFDRYLKTYGEDWVVHEMDSGQIKVKLKTIEEYQPLFQEKERFLVLPSEEITDLYEGKHVHLNATNIQEKIEPQGGESIAVTMQNNIDAVWAQRERTGVPMIVHVNHPNFLDAIRLEDMLHLKGERFFEVYNGHNRVQNQGGIYGLSTEAMWDLINISYVKEGKPLLLGLATDDAHNYHQIGNQWSNAGRGWVQVRADSLTPASLIAALEAGDFYASTGVRLDHLKLEDNVLEVGVAAEEGVNYTFSFIACVRGADKVEVVSTVEGEVASLELKEDWIFARCKITSSKLQENPIEGILYEMAWTQPVQFQ